MVATTISDELKVAWLQMLDEKTDVFWITARYVDTTNLMLIESGIGGRAECLESIKDAQEVIFGGFRVTALNEGVATTQRVSQESSSETSGYRMKYVLFQYNPPSTTVMAKARASSDRGLVQGALHSSHCQFQVEDLDELCEEAIIRKLAVVGGGANRYDFENRTSRRELITHVTSDARPDVDHVVAHETLSADEATVDDAITADEATRPMPPEAAPALIKPPPPPEQPSAAEELNEPAVVIAPPVPIDPIEEATKEVPKIKKASPGSHAILLFTSVPASAVVAGNQTFIRQAFSGRKIPFVEIDGMDTAKKEERNALFAISQLRGK